MTDDGSTAGLTESTRARWSRPGPRRPVQVPALTLLWHPDPRRVGERALLGELVSGRRASVSRSRPPFAATGGPGRPLDDRFLSRRPFLLRATAEQGIEIDPGECRTPLFAGGEPLRRARALPPDAVRQGVAIEVGQRLVLWLHEVALADAAPADRPDHGLVGASDGVERLRDAVGRVGDLEVPVLLRGESGTGKELVARAIHDAGRRRRGPFVSVNLGALPPSLAAAELFGAVKGAFTGAAGSQEGYFRRARGGTLFLDEVGEASVEVQVMLLRALETGEIFPLGSQRAEAVDVRLLAATDSDLDAMVADGRFRQALLYRLASYEVRLPPLRRRMDDLGLLLLHFLRRELRTVGEEHRLADPDGPPLDAALVARLARHHWPGNVRQLRNVVRQLVIDGRGRPRLGAAVPLDELLGPEPLPAAQAEVRPPAAAEAKKRRRPAEVTEAELLASLRQQRFDLQATADDLGISRASLYLLIERSPRARKAGDLDPEEIERCHHQCGGDLEAMVDRLEVSRRALGRRLRELGLAVR